MNWTEYAWVIALVALHELGHMIWAKFRGNYKKIGVLPTPHVKLTQPFPNRLDYLSGLTMSLTALPLYAGNAAIFFAVAVAASIADFVPMLYPDYEALFEEGDCE